MMRPEELGIGTLFERIRDAVIVANPETQQIILWNPAAANLFEYRLSEVPRLRIEALVPEDLKPQHRTGIARYAETGHGSYIDSHRLLELPALKKEGEEIHVEMSLSPIGPVDDTEDGRGRLVLAIIHDITERKRTDEALREAERRFRSALGNAPIGMAVVGLDGRFLQVNRSLCEILGYSEEELLNISYKGITYPEDFDASMRCERQVLGGETSKYHLEKRYLHADGHLVWVSLNVSLVRDSKNRPLYFISQFQDISEHKRVEEERS
jgi:PAS domain S-box-containing protein